MSYFSDWEAQFHKQQRIVLQASADVIEASAAELKTRIENRTPVGDPSLWNWPAHPGYKPGTLKASWTLTKKGSGENLTILIENDVPYGPRVEYVGWSTQAPNGMMRISALEWPAIIEAQAKKNKV